MKPPALVSARLLAAVLALCLATAEATTFSVINTGDSGAGSLRQAIANANSSPGDDDITFDIGGAGPHTIVLATVLPDLTSNIRIINDRAGDEQVTIARSSAAPDFRIFRITSGTTVLLAGVEMTRGTHPIGGGLLVEGATVSVRRCSFVQNLSGAGGGMYVDPSASAFVTVTESHFGGNQAYLGRGGGIYSENAGQLMVGNCTFEGNAASFGGGLYIGAPAQVTNCTFYNNQVSNFGGGIYSVAGSGSLPLKHCTFAGNSAPGTTSGGAIFNESGASTVVSNNIFVSTGSGTIANSGTFISAGHNLSNDPAGGDTGTGPGGFLSGPGDKRNTSPALGAYGFYGGPTRTLPLSSSSPAVDAGTVDDLTSDQRGFPRPTDNPGVPNTGGSDGSDIGAFELRLAQSGSTFTVTNATENNNGCTTDDCSLLEAISAANANPNTNTILFAPSVGATIPVTNPAGLSITAPVSIVGPGARRLALSGQSVARILVLSSYGVSISGLTLRDCYAAGDGGAIYNLAGGLTMTDCTIVSAFAQSPSSGVGNGGALYNSSGAMATLQRCTFFANVATQFGGGAIFNVGTVTATNCTFFGNHAPRGGAILSVSNNGTSLVTLRNCTITGNNASSGGHSADGGGGYYGEGGPNNGLHHFSNTILAGNFNSNNVNPDLRGYGTSEGNNLVGNLGQGGSGFSNGANGDKVGVAPNLAALANNGGPTDTVALFSDSPAINMGNNNLAPLTDQRGYLRSGTSDIGAFEFNGAVPVLRITRLVRAGNDLTLYYSQAVNGLTYRLERTSSLLLPIDWQPARSDFIASVNDEDSVTLSNAFTLPPPQFFRITVP